MGAAASQSKSWPANGRRAPPIRGAADGDMLFARSACSLPVCLSACTSLPVPLYLLCSVCVQPHMPHDPNAVPKMQQHMDASLAWRGSRSGPAVQTLPPPCLLPFAGTWCLTIAMLPLAASVAVSASSQHPASILPAVSGAPLCPPSPRACHLDPGEPRSTRSPDQSPMHATPP
jgi:hypothetical protein